MTSDVNGRIRHVRERYFPLCESRTPVREHRSLTSLHMTSVNVNLFLSHRQY